MDHLGTIGGALRYAFLMQVRRRPLWITLALMSPLLAAIVGNSLQFVAAHTPGGHVQLMDALDYWVYTIMLICPLGAGILLADRVPRDRQTRMEEVLRTYSAPGEARLIGAWLGASLATLVPIALIAEGGAVLLMARFHDGAALVVSWAMVALVMAPSILFVGAVCIAGATVLPLRLAQILFVGAWFWATWLQQKSGIPTVNNTILAPSGEYIGLGLFPSWWTSYAAKSIGVVAPWQAVASLLLLLSVAVLIIVAAGRVLGRRERRPCASSREEP